MQNKSTPSDVQVKHFVQTVSETIGFKYIPPPFFKLINSITLNEFEENLEVKNWIANLQCV